MVRNVALILVLLIASVFAQNEASPVVEMDSVAYYNEMYDYNYQKFCTDESISEVFLWTNNEYYKKRED